MAENRFDLRRLVGDVLDNTQLADPGLIAAEVYQRVPAEHVDTALRQALRLFVRQVMGERRAHMSIVSSPRPPQRSAKVEGIREYWRQALTLGVHVGGEVKWKQLADCTAADLIAAEAERRDLAARNDAKANQYSMLRKLVDEHEVSTVRELPEDVLAETLRYAA